MAPELLHLGCGELIGPSWVNIDGSPNVFLDNHPLLKALLWPVLPASSRRRKFTGARWMDLRRRWRFADGRFDAVFSSHFFEHLTLDEGRHVLRESFRVLKPGGTIRFLLPSLAAEVDSYLQAKRRGDPLAATRFAENSFVFARPQGRWWYRLYFRLMGDKNAHQMFYDAESLTHYFAQSGFENVAARGYLASAIPHLAEVEREDRHQLAICLEARKPALGARREEPTAQRQYASMR